MIRHARAGVSRGRVEHQLSSSPDLRAKMTSKKQASSNGAAAAQVVPDFRVAIDFGTTFTSIAFVRGNGSEVLTVAQFPGDDDMGRNHNQVPIEIQYLDEVNRRQRQRRRARRRTWSSQKYCMDTRSLATLRYPITIRCAPLSKTLDTSPSPSCC
jgi:hypothetical protein